MKKTNIAVLVSGGGTNLQALIDAEKAGIIRSGSIKLVVSNNKDAYALTRAKNNSIDTRVVLRRDYENSHDFEAALIGVLKEADIDMIVLAGFMSILSPDFIVEFRDRMINVHPSLIPSFCGKGFYGLHVHEAALEYGVKVTGATVHFVNEIPDGGKIILQKAVEVQEGDTPEVLQRRVMEQAEWIILPQATEMVAAQLAERK
ncbi:MAG: phosphoribosylglycinamide formyltransferase [Firmicutes bacterium]|nr:phosphoribosylglycinamide formyltransferase [Bacillota bacterium]MBR4023790.1 phosphoribosylglycinamide formyltransferase [Bacillota bacterium]